MFLTLAQAICCCLTHDPVWKDDVISDMLDEMFQIPGEWLRDNVASFLLFCNESVSLNYISFFLLNSIIYLMSLVAQRIGCVEFRIFYLVQLIEHPILRIPNILFVYFLSIFSR